MTDQIPLPGAPLQHFVSSAPFDPMSIEEMTEAQAKVHLASQLKLMWWKYEAPQNCPGIGHIPAVALWNDHHCRVSGSL